jgi:phage N-6-adenine-methyltransferase
MSRLAVHHSSARTDWATPIDFFERCKERFGAFTLDAAASFSNALCVDYFDETANGLAQSWEGHNVWCNHPYGRGHTPKWWRKGFLEAQKPNTRVTMLSPARTDTIAFHEIVLPSANVIVFIRGRLKFAGAKDPAPFPSMLIRWDGSEQHRIETMNAQ